MTIVSVAPIVEGHGEVQAVRTLLTRIAAHFTPECHLDVLQPIRVAKSKVLVDDDELLRAVDLAALKLQTAQGDRKFVLLLLDADADLACELAPRLLARVRSERGHLDVSCVIAVIEYETWMVAGAASLQRLMRDGYDSHVPSDPEGERVGKGWIEHFFNATKYSETVDQVRLTAAFDVAQARARSASFDKLCRELASRCSESLRVF